ncbi:hypothetical protein [Aeromonas phage yong1]|uniref:Uncharacterized protein n=1 Tax=Aeromonas phage yong1 TaxID=2924882 RepID=A0A9X9E5K1_9CAUD|nr:hypothetical protein [Aeromonas phage yong1]UPI11727.1 hypothetical protein [Aeromonas phage yong1]
MVAQSVTPYPVRSQPRGLGVSSHWVGATDKGDYSKVVNRLQPYLTPNSQIRARVM